MKGSRWLTLHRVGIEADPAPVCRPGGRPEGSEPGLATRTRGTGVGPLAARELNPRLRTRLQPSPSGGSLRTIACQRPDEAAKGTGPGPVRWRLTTRRSHVRLRSRVKPRGKQGFRDAIRVGGFRNDRCQIAHNTISELAGGSGGIKAICRQESRDFQEALDLHSIVLSSISSR